jgi:hypothetical protein
MKEIWKDIPNYEGCYQASSFGRVRTCEGKITNTIRHGERHWKSRIMKGRGKQIGGFRVSLWKDGIYKDWRVARLITMTFYGIPKVDLTVNHKDGNRFNNRVENLEWMTLGDNIRHGFENGLYPQIKVILISELGEKLEFSSLAEGSRWLHKNVGYLSYCLKKGRKARTYNGYEFQIII